MRMEVHIYNNVNVKSQAGNIWEKDTNNSKRPKPKEKQLGILNIFAFCQKIQQKTLGPGECCWCYIYTQKLPHLPPKSYYKFT